MFPLLHGMVLNLNIIFFSTTQTSLLGTVIQSTVGKITGVGKFSQSFQLTHHQLSTFPKKLSSFITSNHWNFPADLLTMFPTLKILADQVVIPNQPTRDKLILKHSTNGDMTLKEAYNFKKSNSTKLPWAKLIWSNDVPPSKSLMVWRLMLDKLPTDDIL